MVCPEVPSWSGYCRRRGNLCPGPASPGLGWPPGGARGLECLLCAEAKGRDCWLAPHAHSAPPSLLALLSPTSLLSPVLEPDLGPLWLRQPGLWGLQVSAPQSSPATCWWPAVVKPGEAALVGTAGLASKPCLELLTSLHSIELWPRPTGCFLKPPQLVPLCFLSPHLAGMSQPA